MNMVGVFVFSCILGVSYSSTIFGGSLDEQIARMHELQVKQGSSNQNVKSRAEKNKVPEFKQRLLEAERILNREDRAKDRQESYENELMDLDLEARRLKAKVAKTVVDETDFTYSREKKRIDIELRQIEVESRSIELERKKERVAQDENFKIDIELRKLDLERKQKRVSQEENFILLELDAKAALIKSEEAKAESSRNISAGIQTGLEGVGEAAKRGDLFD